MDTMYYDGTNFLIYERWLGGEWKQAENIYSAWSQLAKYFDRQQCITDLGSGKVLSTPDKQYKAVAVSAS